MSKKQQQKKKAQRIQKARKAQRQNFIQKLDGATPEEQGTFLLSEDGVVKLYSDPETNESMDDILARVWVEGVVEKLEERLHLAVETYDLDDMEDGFELDSHIEFDETKKGAGKLLLTIHGIPRAIWQPIYENRDGLFDPELLGEDMFEATNDAIAETLGRATGRRLILLTHHIEGWPVQVEDEQVGGLQIKVTNLPPLDTWLFKAVAA
ncbi:MAG: hypothetical protein EHM13_08490 [Acidobacteria bacterium]|nr:MAG: hypothetical protein EHM13_08490 [Acidobacteriota bacterium]